MPTEQKYDQAAYSRKHRRGVATELREIRAELEDLSLAVRAVLAERRQEQPKD